MLKKFKLFSRLKVNVLEHPKITQGRLKRQKWLKLKTSLPRRSTDFGDLLLSKQKLRAFYGNCSERAFISLYKKAKKLNGNTGINFIKLLECRIDSVLFRMKFANTFEEIRQMISHKNILVNGSIVTNKSFVLKSGDVISVSDDSFDFIYKRVLFNLEQYLNRSETEMDVENNISFLKRKHQLLFTPEYLDIDYSTLRGIFIDLPSLSQVIYPYHVDLPKIMEYYEYKKKI